MENGSNQKIFHISFVIGEFRFEFTIVHFPFVTLALEILKVRKGAVCPAGFSLDKR
jgi:hypothetical protein